MKYNKPEIALLANAAAAIQGSSDKSRQVAQDAGFPVITLLATTAAYESDE